MSVRKATLIEQLVREFRSCGNQDMAFDQLAAESLQLNRTDLHCINIVESAGGMSAGQLAIEAGLTTGAVTGVIDRLEHAGLAHRRSDPDDRRRVLVEVTPEFVRRAANIWGPLRADWEATLTRSFTTNELDHALAFLRAVNEISARHLERLRAPE